MAFILTSFLKVFPKSPVLYFIPHNVIKLKDLLITNLNRQKLFLRRLSAVNFCADVILAESDLQIFDSFNQFRLRLCLLNRFCRLNRNRRQGFRPSGIRIRLSKENDGVADAL